MALRAALVVLAAILLAACGGEAEEEGVLAPGTFQIGFVSARASPFALRDREIGNAAQIAVGQINGAGGIDGVLRLRLQRATVGGAATAAAEARKLVREGARALLLGCDASVQRAVAEVAERRGLPLLAACDRRSVRARYPRYWPVGVSTSFQAAALAAYANEERWPAVLLLDTADEGVAAAFRAAARADAVVLSVPLRDAPEAVARLRRRGVQAPVLATDALESTRFLDGSGSALEGATFTTFGFPEPGSALDEFFVRYAERFGGPPDSSAAALGYEAVKVLEAAINVFESADASMLQRALRDGIEVGGPLGPISYAPRGDRSVRAGAALVTVRDGHPELLDRIAPRDE